MLRWAPQKRQIRSNRDILERIKEKPAGTERDEALLDACYKCIDDTHEFKIRDTSKLLLNPEVYAHYLRGITKIPESGKTEQLVHAEKGPLLVI